MAVLHVTSPHTHKPFNTGRFMLQVVWATIPGLIALTYFFGWGTLINVALACLTAVACEAAILKLRNRSVSFFLKDNSALVTGLLLALAIPPTSPWWLTVTGTAFAIIIAKQLYGGLGSNPFNPAMIGYVLLLISFPKEMTAWLPAAGSTEQAQLSVIESFSAIFSSSVNGAGIDSFTAATPLDTFKTYAGDFATLESSPIMHGALAGVGWDWVNLAFLAGGLFLIARRIITWHIPVGMLGAMILCAGLGHGIDADRYASPLFHLLSGGTMLGAFFIATDPVTAATSNKGKIYYGAGIGILIYIIRAWGGYPDAVAFSVLIMNLAAPTIDYYTQPRAYGHSKPVSGAVKKD